MCLCASSFAIGDVFAGDGHVFTWGRNDFGQLGIGDINNCRTPTAVSLVDDEAVEELHCGNFHFFIRVGVCVCVCVCRSCDVCVVGQRPVRGSRGATTGLVSWLWATRSIALSPPAWRACPHSGWRRCRVALSMSWL